MLKLIAVEHVVNNSLLAIIGVLTRRIGTWTESTSENLAMLTVSGAESMIMMIFIPDELAMVCVLYVRCIEVDIFEVQSVVIV